jgi:hypothetical protein
MIALYMDGWIGAVVESSKLVPLLIVLYINHDV